MTYAYDNANRLTTVTDWNSRAVAYAYDDAGRMTTATLPSSTNIVSSFGYDNADRLTSVSHVKNGNTTIASASYTLDAVGNRTQRVDQQGTHTYAYDNAYRLTSVTYPGPATTSYAFDAFGNRTSKTEPGSQTTTYAYNDGDRLTSVTPPGQSAISYTWDNNGNLTARSSDSFSWDYEDRMTSATVGGTTTTFAYRGDGLRHSKTTGGNTTTFTWDVNGGLPVVLDDGNQYVYGAGLEAMVTGGGTYYYLADGLGSTMAMVDTSGNVQKSYTYDIYGKATPTGSLANEFDFAGQETDGSTGVQYLRARYMDTATGTFVSREPMAGSPAWTGNHYAYGGGNPTRYTDPTGRVLVEEGEGANGCSRTQCTVEFSDPTGTGSGGAGWLGPVAGAFLDVAALASYGLYYSSYQSLSAIDAGTQALGSFELAIDLGLLPATVPLVILEGVGLGGDIAIDLIKDAIGQGQGWADEGTKGDICPDPIENLPGVDCPQTYLPGIHGTEIVNEKGRKTGKIDTHNPSSVDFNWGF